MGEAFSSAGGRGVAPGQDALVRAKLRAPSARDPVPRARLHERLDRRAGGALTLVSAPAGFGKSTLLAEWGRSSGLPVGWVSLDEGDEDPSRFLSYLVAALRRVAPGAGEAVLFALRSPEPRPVEAVLTPLVNELHDEMRGEEEVVLVLDDYHLVGAAEAVHRAVAFLIDNSPPRLRLVLSARADPPLPLARIRAQGRLLELRTADLRFTPKEAAALLNGAMGIGLSPG